MAPKQARFALVGACVLAAGLLIWGANLSELAEPPAVTAGSPAPEAECRYILGVYRGEAAVFLPKQTYGPKYCTGIQVDSLPQADREALEAGIPIYTDAQLTALLEDLGS